MVRIARGYLGVFFCACAITLCAFGYAHADVSEFSSNLMLGDRSIEVQTLQVFLNSHGFPLASSGPGSPSNENNFFGSLTHAALERFQSAHGLPATGYFGPQTRAMVENLIENISAPTPENTIAPSSTPADSSQTQMSSWLAFFNSHAPPPGWIPGFGGGSAPVSSSQTPSAPPDTTPPSVDLTAPAGGQTLAGIIALTASSSDNVGVASVQFAIDAIATSTPITLAPYTFNWDSAFVSDGTHTIAAVARDAAGNVATSSSVTITTENAPLMISLISSMATLDDTGEIIGWSTSEAANAKVVYGTTMGGPYPSSVSSATLTTTHSITLPGLAGGNYYFKVVSTNAVGATATSSEQSFTLIVLG